VFTSIAASPREAAGERPMFRFGFYRFGVRVTRASARVGTPIVRSGHANPFTRGLTFVTDVAARVFREDLYFGLS